VGTAVVRRDDFNVLAIPAAVRLLIFDADVREMDLLIEVGQVVLERPLTDFLGGAIGVTIVVVPLPVTFVEPLLLIALELVVEDYPVDAHTALR